jgi:N-acetylglucosamine-6-phosphate deacetylase
MSQTLFAIGPDGPGAYEVDFSTGAPVLSSSSVEPSGILCPGFVDIHIHGAFGTDLMTGTTEELNKLCSNLSECGYEGFLPTTVTASPEDVAKALANLPDNPMILGFHLEGPFISPDYPGAQPPHAIIDVPPSDGPWAEILDDPRLRVITMAPEKPGALELAAKLHARGVRVSMGHTNAVFNEAKAGYDAGFRHATHTFNAMRGFHHREAGTAGFCLAEDGMWCELIYDRIHVSPDSAKLLVKSKPNNRLIGISDSTLASGLPAGQKIKMWGLDCITTDGEIRLASGALAGSAITLLDAFRNLTEDFGAETAIRACSLNPRATLGMKGDPKVWLEFDNNLALKTIHRV